jgi:hypothetical protein
MSSEIPRARAFERADYPSTIGCAYLALNLLCTHGHEEVYTSTEIKSGSTIVTRRLVTQRVDSLESFSDVPSLRLVSIPEQKEYRENTNIEINPTVVVALEIGELPDNTIGSFDAESYVEDDKFQWKKCVLFFLNDGASGEINVSIIDANDGKVIEDIDRLHNLYFLLQNIHQNVVLDGVNEAKEMVDDGTCQYKDDTVKPATSLPDFRGIVLN